MLSELGDESASVAGTFLPGIVGIVACATFSSSSDICNFLRAQQAVGEEEEGSDCEREKDGDGEND